MIVNEQVNIPISIDKYQDKVLFDIVPIEVGYILLGRP